MIKSTEGLEQRSDILFITYSHPQEVIVTTSEMEKEMIEEYFTQGGRDLDEYDRNEVRDTAVSLRPRIYAW